MPPVALGVRGYSEKAFPGRNIAVYHRGRGATGRQHRRKSDAAALAQTYSGGARHSPKNGKPLWAILPPGRCDRGRWPVVILSPGCFALIMVVPKFAAGRAASLPPYYGALRALNKLT